MKSQTQGLPLLSIHDPEGAGSTSLDPLGLTPIGEQLSVELIPGVRERQTHPRYLTAIAVSHAVCQDFSEDTAASDGFSEPWQVFEWYVVEGLVRSAGSTSDAKVPGSQKTKKALSQGLPLCASRYLKTPAIFGFHGVYRLLARTLWVASTPRVSDAGGSKISKLVSQAPDESHDNLLGAHPVNQSNALSSSKPATTTAGRSLFRRSPSASRLLCSGRD